MIVRPGPALSPEDAASRVSAGRDPVWQTSPGHDGDAEIAWDVVAADPVATVDGDDAGAWEESWQQARARWACREPGVPLAFGVLPYELGMRWMGLGAADSGHERERDGAGPRDLWSTGTFRFYDAIWRRTRQGRSELLATDEAAASRLEARLTRDDARETTRETTRLALSTWRSAVPRAAYEAHVRQLLAHIAAGDIYQANYARRLEASFTAGDSCALAVALRAEAPAPHAFWMSLREEGAAETVALVGNSPERFLLLDGQGRIETRPIKGTRRRDADPLRDAAAIAALSSSSKDLAEHVMIVDLERNDLGRLCRAGTVAVSGMARVVSLPTVHHLVTTVQGRLRAGVGLAETLQALFPGGSITGAPKHRAMQLIAEAEKGRARGAYTGATGWLGAAGDADLAIAIRTATVVGRELSLWVGGGIVADSQPADEWDETVAKAAAFARVGGSGVTPESVF